MDEFLDDMDDEQVDDLLMPEEDETSSSQMYEHFRFVADKGQSLLRVDKFLVDRMMGATRNRIQLAAEAGCILVNDKPVKSNYRVKPLDVVSIVMDRPRRELEIIPEDIPLNIVYEDDDLLVVNKPKGMVVHPAPGTQLPFEGGHNFRELGGYEADEGKHIKWGQIYRGIPTWKLTSEADRKLLDSLGLRLILDLRSEAEAAETPDYVPDGARLVRICGLCLENGKEVDFSPEDRENLLKGMPDEGRRMADAMYERMLFGNKAYKELFRALEAGETPVLFHCSAGKDRTGVAAILILLALGASDKTIAEDFEKTNIWRRPELEAVWAEHAEEIAADPARKDFYLGVFGVHPESAPFVLGIIRERYGSADAYLEAEYGLTPARLMRLRRMYLE